ncbi:MAG: hypothetical protein AAFX93_08900 [Verrucomicrobiota bacterium]
MKANPLLLIAGIGIGLFGHAFFSNIGESDPVPVEPISSILETDDLSELKARLAASQRRVSRLESMLSAATMAENRLQQIKDPDNTDTNQIGNIADLIDRSKPVLRALILPEIERSIANNEWGDDFELNYWADTLELSPDQRSRLRGELDALARARAEIFMDQLKDDQTSMFSLFQQMSDYENIGDPKVDSIYAKHLDPDQREQYDQHQFDERMERVDSEAANRLDMIGYHIPDLSETQQDQIYTALARSSRAYTPEMQIAAGDNVSPEYGPLTGEERDLAIEQILLPHQQSDWAVYRNRQEILSGIGDFD